MLGFEHNRYAKRFDFFHEGLSDLRGQPLLHLQAAGEDFNQTRHLGKSNDSMVRQIGDMCLAHEGQQMMLAQGVKIEVFAQDHLLVRVLGEKRAIDDFFWVLAVTARKKAQRFDDTMGRSLKSVARGVLTNLPEQFADQILSSLPVVSHLIFPFPRNRRHGCRARLRRSPSYGAGRPRSGPSPAELRSAADTCR
jgi:hypothetical protein